MESKSKNSAIRIWEYIKSPGFMAVVAIASLAIGVYLGVFYEKKPEISISISPPAKVLDIHETVGGLDVSYAGQNLKDSGKTLWAIVAYISNTGNTGINKIDFDDEDLLGIRLLNGEIADKPEARGNVDYLNKNLKITTSKDYIKINPVIIEPGDTISINFLVLGIESARPEFSVIGKISGINDPTISRLEDDQKKSTWNRVTHAEKWWVHFLRMPVYFGLLILTIFSTTILFALFIIPITSIKDSRSKKELRQRVDNYKIGETLTREARILINAHMKSPNSGINTIYSGLCKLEQRERLREKLSNAMDSEEANNVCFRCYPINHLERRKIEDDLGLALEKNIDIENINKWKFELSQLADYLKIELEEKISTTEIVISPELEARLTPRAIAIINQEIDLASSTDGLNP